jgi:hypothetical protein
MCECATWCSGGAIPRDVLGKLQGWVAGWPHHWLSTFSNHQRHPPFRACVLPKLDAGVNVNAGVARTSGDR